MQQSPTVDMVLAQRDELAERLLALFRSFERQTGLQVDTVAVARDAGDEIDAVQIDARLARPRPRLRVA